RTAVEDNLVRAVLAGLAVLHRSDEGAVLVPVLEDALLDLREAWAGRHLRVGGLLAHRLVGSWGSVCGSAGTLREDDGTFSVSPRYHPACRLPRRLVRNRIRPLLPKAVTGPPVRV